MPIRSTPRLNIAMPIGSRSTASIWPSRSTLRASRATIGRPMLHATTKHLIDDKRFCDEAELQAYMQYRFDWLGASL